MSFGSKDVLIVESLMSIVPFALCCRYDDFAHCIEASVAGATVLRRLGYDAKAVPCSAMVRLDSQDVGVGMGMTPEDLGGASIYKEAANGVHSHAIILLDTGRHKYLIDLTLAQAWKIIGPVVPSSILLPVVDGLPSVSRDGFSIRYFESKQKDEVQKLIDSCNADGLAGDMHDLTVTMAAYGNDVDRFFDMMAMSNPDLMQQACKRMGLASKQDTRFLDSVQ